MKKIIYSLAFGLALFAGSCKDEDTKEEAKPSTPTVNEPVIAETQQATAIYFGGTWCPPCGAYGKPAKEALKAQVGKSKVTVISCQLNGGVADPFNNADADALAGVFAVTGVPAMWIGGAETPITQVQSNSQMSANCVSTANAVIAKKPIANLIADFTLDKDFNMVLEVNTKFFNDVTEEYYLAAYLLEDGLQAPQASDASVEKNIHYSVLRQKMSTSVTGDLITSGPTAKSKVINKKFSTPLSNPAFKKEKLSAAVVLWKKGTDGKFTISNTIHVDLKL
jgi:hypothetical protein